MECPSAGNNCNNWSKLKPETNQNQNFRISQWSLLVIMTVINTGICGHPLMKPEVTMNDFPLLAISNGNGKIYCLKKV